MKLSSLLKLYVYFLLPHCKTSTQQNEATDFPLPHFRFNFRHISRLSKIIFHYHHIWQSVSSVISFPQTSANVESSLSTWIGFAI
jgi:hypothetical protein